MKLGLYIRLAWSNIRKNARLYVPNILSGMGLLGVFYIILTLSMDERLSGVRGGGYIGAFMALGVGVIAPLSLILILYTNSFLMKRRSREFGLYNVLGMEKGHIGKILFWETAICAGFVLTGGLLAGILLYKLCALLICRVLAVDSVLGFYHVSLKTLVPSGMTFLGLYLLTYLMNRIRIARMNPVELLQSVHTGEREPKVKWLLLLVGMVSLTGGYCISLNVSDPMAALELFFPAVILVIIGTYCLFLTGSTAFLKMLKGNKQFYYQKNHMIAVSGLLYRMKQNAVGLASITVLATMVIVTVSTTVSMYAGIDDAVRRQYPHQASVYGRYYTQEDEMVNIPGEDLLTLTREAAGEQGLSVSFAEEQKYLACAFLREGDNLRPRLRNEHGLAVECWFITAEEYQKLTGDRLVLSENQIAVYDHPKNIGEMPGKLSSGARDFEPTAVLESFPIPMGAVISDCYGFVVSDEGALEHIYAQQKKAREDIASEISCDLLFDFDDEKLASAVYPAFESGLEDKIREYCVAQPGCDGKLGMRVSSKWKALEEFYGMNGTLLFLGIILSVVFLFATALIIYYKQISEGYEDRARFQIMQKVGMSGEEIRKAIRSQILLVFFLPLGVAAVHMAFAFPMLTQLLRILFQPNRALFLACTGVTLGVFALIYVLIYSITAKVYYRIVR